MLKTKIAIGCDHRGFGTKVKILEHYANKTSGIQDKGCYNTDSCDYPDYAKEVCASILVGESDRGILICGSGVGMCMAANRYPGIRAVLAQDQQTAEMSRRHNDSNVICLPGIRMEEGGSIWLHLLDSWFATEFEGGRHKSRIAKMGGYYD